MKTARDAVSVILSSVAVMGVRLVTLSLLARLLAPEHFGVVAMGITIQAVISLLAQLDVRDALIQAPEISRRHLRIAWQALAASAVLAGLVMLALAAPLERWTGVEGLAPVLRVLGLLTFFDVFLVPVEAMLIRRGAVRAVTQANVVAYGLGFGGVGGVMAWLAPGPMALAVAWNAAGAVRLGVSLWQLRRLPPDPAAFAAPTEAGRGVLLAQIMRFALFGTGNRVLATSAKQVDNLVVGTVLGGGPLGFYSRAYALAETPINTLLGLTIRSVIFPALARMAQDRARFAAAVTHAITAGVLLILPVGLCLAVAAPECVAILLGPGWEPAIFPLRCLAFALGLTFGPRLADSVGRAVGRQSFLFAMNLGMTLALAALVWIGARLGGIDGAALAVLAASLAQWAVSLGLAARISGAPVRALLRAMVRPAVLSLAAAAVFWGVVTGLRASPGLPLVTLLLGGPAMLGTVAGGIVALPWVFLGPWERGVLAQALAKILPARGIGGWVLARLRGG